MVTGAGLGRGGCFPRATSGSCVLTHALQQVAIVVEALLAVALVAGLRVHALALLADLFSKQYALVDVCVTEGNVNAKLGPLGWDSWAGLIGTVRGGAYSASGRPSRAPLKQAQPYWEGAGRCQL